MTIDYDKIKNWQFEDVEQTYTEKDSMLYALGVGYGYDPMDEAQLQFVYEKNLKAVPTMPVVLGYPGFWMKTPAAGIDWMKILHGEQGLRIHRAIPASGTVIGRTRVKAIVDKGKDKGALVYQERTITDKASGALLATIDHVTFCRADGGGGKSDAAPPPRPQYLQARRISPAICRRCRRRLLSIACPPTTTRCMPNPRWPRPGASRAPSCTGCVVTVLPDMQSSKRAAVTIRPN